MVTVANAIVRRAGQPFLAAAARARNGRSGASDPLTSPGRISRNAVDLGRGRPSEM